MRAAMSSAIGNTCSPAVQEANSDDSKIQPSSCFLILALSLTKHCAMASSRLGCPFRTAAAYCMTGVGGVAFAPACGAGRGGGVDGMGVPVAIDKLRASDPAEMVAVTDR